jgi:hypothetical protein
MTVFSSAQKDGLEQILRLMDAHNLSGADVKKAAAEHKKTQKSGGKEFSKGEMIMRLFAYMGGALIFAGLSVFIETIWEDIGSLSRVIITLGTGFVAYICGIVFALDKRFEKAATPAFILAFIMQPMGLFVLLDEYFPGDNPALGGMVVFAPLAIQQLLTFMRFRFSSLLLYSLLYILGFAFSFVEYFDIDRGFRLAGARHVPAADYDQYAAQGQIQRADAAVLRDRDDPVFCGRLLLCGPDDVRPAGAVAHFRAAGLRGDQGNQDPLCDVYALYVRLFHRRARRRRVQSRLASLQPVTAIFTGTSLVLAGQWLRERTNYISLFPLWMFVGTGYALAGFYGVMPAALEPVGIAVSGLAIYGALQLKSRAVLAAAVLSMISFIIKYSAEHFANTIAWPVMLIFFGILVLASGFVFARLSGRIKASA